MKYLMSSFGTRMWHAEKDYNIGSHFHFIYENPCYLSHLSDNNLIITANDSYIFQMKSLQIHAK